MLLTIDAGNTRTKWAVFNATGQITHQGACLNTAIQSLSLCASTLHYQRIIISNVAGKQHGAAIQSKLTPNYPIQWLVATQATNSLINHYTKPSSLGSDRWAALTAAWHMQHTPCIVVNAGTAVTIDAVVPQAKQAHIGEFLGGIIMPGISLMQQSLSQAAAQLPKLTHTQIDIPNIFATSTEQAIYAGALNAITGAIAHMVDALILQYQQTPNIIISGGDAHTILTHYLKSNLNKLANHVVIVDNLVLQGLFLLDNAFQNSKSDIA